MPASYPSAIKTFTTLVDGVDDVLASHQNDPNAEITAIETELGTNPRGTAADVKTRLDAAHNSDGTQKTDSVPTAAIQNSAVTESKIASSAVAQAKLKTAIGEISSSVRVLTTLPGGEYGFYPQHKSSIGGSQNAHFWQMGGAGFPVDPGTTYQTRITTWPDSSQTLSAQQRYVTASGLDLWIFALVEIATGDIMAAWQAFDHPAYGNGGNLDLVPHPFLGSTMPPGTRLMIVEKSTALMLLQEARTQKRSLLDVLNEELHPELDATRPFEALHSGLFDPDMDDQGQQRRDKDGEMLWRPRMVTSAPAGLPVHSCKLMTPAEQQQRKNRIQARMDATAQRQVQLAAKIKGKLNLTDTELAELKELLLQ